MVDEGSDERSRQRKARRTLMEKGIWKTKWKDAAYV